MTKAGTTIHSPLIDGDVLQYLTSYFWRDDSSYTVFEYDYRLRWTLTYGPSGRPSQYVTATVELWNRPTGSWNELWTIGPVSDNHRETWRLQQLADDLADKARQILFRKENI